MLELSTISSRETSELINLATKFIGGTMGPGGGTVLIKGLHGKPVHPTKDGVTVMNAFIKALPKQSMILEVLQEASINTFNKVGDGTSSTFVLGAELIKTSLASKEYKSSRSTYLKKLKEFPVAFKESLRMNSRKFEEADIQSLVEVSSNGDKEIVDALMDIFTLEKVNMDIDVTPDPVGYGITHDTIKGYTIKTQVFSDHVNATYKETTVLIFPKKVDVNSIPLNKEVVVLGDFDTTTLNAVLRKNISAMCVGLPYRGRRRVKVIEDLSEISTSKATNGDILKLDFNEVQTLKGKVRFEGTTATSEYIKVLEDQLEVETNEYDQRSYRQRLSMLQYGSVSMLVGGATNGEVKERLDRIDDAIKAIKSASVKGITLSGGKAYIHSFPFYEYPSIELKYAFACIRNIIAYNAAGSPVVRKMSDSGYKSHHIEGIVGDDINNIYEMTTMDSSYMVETVVESAVSAAVIALSSIGEIHLK